MTRSRNSSLPVIDAHTHAHTTAARSWRATRSSTRLARTLQKNGNPMRRGYSSENSATQSLNRYERVIQKHDVFERVVVLYRFDLIQQVPHTPLAHALALAAIDISQGMIVAVGAVVWAASPTDKLFVLLFESPDLCHR